MVDSKLLPPASALSRRTFILGMLTTGYAVAASPVEDNIIRTDTQGLTTGAINIPTATGLIPGYYARPAKSGRFPVVLVIHEAFGVHEHIQDICRRYAKVGYLAIAPELFIRQGDVTKHTEIVKIFNEVISKVPDDQVNSDLDATLAYARKSLQGHKSLAGAVGYCWGGRAVWEYAYHNPKLTAGLAYYGRVEGMVSDERPLDPIDFGSEIKVPVLGLYGEKTPAFLSTRWRVCRPNSISPAVVRRSLCCPVSVMPSTPTTAPITTRRRPRKPGPWAWPGSANTACPVWSSPGAAL